MKIDGAPIIVGGLAMLLRLGMLQTSRIGFVGAVFRATACFFPVRSSEETIRLCSKQCHQVNVLDQLVPDHTNLG